MWEDGFRTRREPIHGGSIATIMSLMVLNPSSHTAALTLVRRAGSADLIIADPTRYFLHSAPLLREQLANHRITIPSRGGVPRHTAAWRDGSRYAARTVARAEEGADYRARVLEPSLLSCYNAPPLNVPQSES